MFSFGILSNISLLFSLRFCRQLTRFLLIWLTVSIFSKCSQGFSSFSFPISTVMYPDPEHFYNEDDDDDFYCPNIHEHKFMECLDEKEVLTNDTNNEGYRSCLESKKKRFQKCNEEKGFEYVLRRHLN